MLKLYENIKKLRKAANMTQQDLAERIGYMDRSIIAKIEKGSVDLSQSKIRQIAEVFGIAPGELMGYDDTLHSPVQIFRTNLDYYMNTRGMTYDEVAYATGANAWDVINWDISSDKSGKHYPTDEQLNKLAKYLGIKVRDLTEETLRPNVKPTPKSELSEKRQQLIDFAMTVPEDKLALILRLAKSVLADE